MKNLSLVFQGTACKDGKLDVEIYRNLKRTRYHFPESPFILSTWRYSPEADKMLCLILSDLKIQVIFSDDPGPLTVNEASIVHVNNINRMLVSSRAGLQAVTTPLVVKLRTDTWLSGRRITFLLDRYVLQEEGPIRNPAFKVFRSRVINASSFARDARGSLPYLFHPSDILLAGLTPDILHFFSAPQADKQMFRPSSMQGLWCAWSYVPEQWCWSHAIRQGSRKIKLKWNGNFDNSTSAISDSEQYYLANFIPFSFFSLNLHWPKYWKRYPLRGLFSTVTHRRWIKLYEYYQRGADSNDHPYGLTDRIFSGIWRNGYRLRAFMLRSPVIRKALFRLFGRRP